MPGFLVFDKTGNREDGSTSNRVGVLCFFTPSCSGIVEADVCSGVDELAMLGNNVLMEDVGRTFELSSSYVQQFSGQEYVGISKVDVSSNF